MKLCENCNNECNMEFMTVCGEQVNIYKCKKCGLYHVPDANFNFELVNNVSLTKMEKGLKALRLHNYGIIINYMKNILPRGSKGLEIGSLHGWFLDTVNEYYDCVGIEPLKEVVNTNNNHTIYKGFFPMDLPNDVTNFDFIIFNDVFEHIPNCNETMKNCYDKLKTGGYVIINIPLSSGIFFKIAHFLKKIGKTEDYIRMWQFKFSSPHIYYFNKRNLMQLGEKNGLKFVHFENLETLDKKSINERITTDTTEKKSNFKSVIIKVGYPLLRFFSKDTGFMVFKKI